MTISPLSPRIFRVHGSDYYSDEVLEAPDTHTDEALATIAAMGYDGVWIHAELRELIPTSLLAPYVEKADERLNALAVVAKRARKHGVGLWLYLNEPRGYPRVHPFWTVHPECQGEPGSDSAIAWRRGKEWLETYAMCVSAAPVRQFLREAMHGLCSHVPELAGAFVITASEHHTHCYSHFGFKNHIVMQCPRCKERAPQEMTIDIARELQSGIEQAGSSARLAMWNWSWNAQMENAQIQALIDGLPPRVALLSDFERGETVARLGKPMLIDEYSFAITGPSERFRDCIAMIGDSGREIWAKLQIGVTHELATVPNIPVPGVLYDKIAAARNCGVSGIMATWSIGLLPTLNSYTAGHLMALSGELPPRRDFLHQLARDYFDAGLSAEDIDRIVNAWDAFGEAMSNYPSLQQFVYFSPVNYAPAYPWKLDRGRARMARSWTTDVWGDLLEMATSTFSLEEIGAMMDRVATLWLHALDGYRQALAPLAENNRHAREELNSATACGYFFRSCADCFLFTAANESGHPVETLTALIDRETATCQTVLPILDTDARIGVHDEANHRMIHSENVREKLRSLVALREEVIARGGARATTA